MLHEYFAEMLLHFFAAKGDQDANATSKSRKVRLSSMLPPFFEFFIFLFYLFFLSLFSYSHLSMYLLTRSHHIAPEDKQQAAGCIESHWRHCRRFSTASGEEEPQI